MNLSDIILHSLIKKENLNTEKAISLIYDLIDHSYNNQLGDIKLIKESELNSIEYKLRLDTKTSYGLEKTMSQIKRRLTTSKQLTEVEEAHYIFGVTDKGELGNITLEETEATYNIFKELVESKKLNANICYKFEYLFGNSSIYYVIINKKNNIKFNELKISFVGTSSSGKTTTISNIIHGSISKKKINLLFKHEHEKLSGKTSSIKKEIIGLKSGKIVNYKTIKDSNSTDIAIESDIIINILDYPGDIKKIKNIFKGLLGYSSDLIFIVVECFKLYDPSTREIIDLYYNISKLLNIKSVILANKIDILDNPICLTTYYPDLPIIYISNIFYISIVTIKFLVFIITFNNNNLKSKSF
jgi:GTPase